MRILKAIKARFHSPARSGPRQPSPPLRGKALAALAPVLLLAALALLPSSAFAAEEPCTNNVLCDNAGTALRDDFNAPKGFGTDMLATNTQATLRLVALAGETPVFSNSNPANYAYFGLELLSNPATSTEVCNDAEGWVTFADIQNATPSPVYAGISPTRFGPWPFTVKSDNTGCPEAERGRVTIEDTHLFFSAAEATASGTFVGSYEQPGANCEGGGVKLDVAQPGITVEAGGEKFAARVDNGAEVPSNAFICFVSANNSLFPTTAPTWEPLTGAIWKD